MYLRRRKDVQVKNTCLCNVPPMTQYGNGVGLIFQQGDWGWVITTVDGVITWKIFRKQFHRNLQRARDVGTLLKRSFGNRHWIGLGTEDWDKAIGRLF